MSNANDPRWIEAAMNPELSTAAAGEYDPLGGLSCTNRAPIEAGYWTKEERENWDLCLMTDYLDEECEVSHYMGGMDVWLPKLKEYCREHDLKSIRVKPPYPYMAKGLDVFGFVDHPTFEGYLQIKA